MQKEEFYFDSRDNHTKIHAIRWTPDGDNVVGVVQIVHGMAEYVERYEEFATFLTEHHFVVTGEDHLGHGGSVSEDGMKGYFCEQDPATVVVRDVHRLKKMTQELYPGVPYFIIGHSMGSFMTRDYLCRYGSGIDGAVIAGTGMLPETVLLLSKPVTWLQGIFKGQKHISQYIDKRAFGSYNKSILNPRTPADWLTSDEKKVDEYIADPNCGFTFTVNGFKTLFTLISRTQKKKNVKNIPKELPVLMISGEADPVGDYGKGVRKAYSFLQGVGLQNLQLKLYPEDRHELLNERNRQQVMEDIMEWLTKHLVIPTTI